MADNDSERMVYDVETARHKLGISKGLMYEAIRRGDIYCLKIGRRLLIPRAALERLLKAPEDVD